MGKTIGVWGTLRRGHGNHFRLNGAKKIQDDTLTGYGKSEYLSLYKNKDAKLTLEVYEVDNKTFNQVDSFERMFGYTPVEKTLDSGITATIWFDNTMFNKDLIDEYSETWTALAEYDNHS